MLRFGRMPIVTRLTWRIGAAVTHPERVVSLAVAGVEGG
jgi:hypothetical protein